MSNPFDNIINMDDNQNGGIERRVEKNTHDKDKVNISLSFNKRVIERLFFLGVIIALAAFIVMNPFKAIGVCDEEESSVAGAVVVEDKSAEVKVSSSAEETESAAEKEEISKESASESSEEEGTGEETTSESSEETEETTEDEMTNEEKKETRSFKVNFDFDIEKVDYEEDEDGNPTKIKSIKFEMKNRWADFKPLVEVYWYDSASNEVIKEKVRSSMEYITVKEGTSVKYTIRSFDSSYFDPADDETEIIELRLYDQDTKLLLDTDKTTLHPSDI